MIKIGVEMLSIEKCGVQIFWVGLNKKRDRGMINETFEEFLRTWVVSRERRR